MDDMTRTDATIETGPAIEGPAPTEGGAPTIDNLLDVPLQFSVELGRTRIPLGELLNLVPGSVVELDKAAGEALDLLVNGRAVARGEAVVVNERFGVRITEVLSPSDRLQRLSGGE